MQINLNQREIEAALTMYIQEQGINLYGKTVEINFTAGRKESGISAEVDIGNVVAPDTRVYPTQYPKLDRDCMVMGHAPIVAYAATGSSANHVEPEAIPVEVEDTGEPVAEVPAKSAVSLFG